MTKICVFGGGGLVGRLICPALGAVSIEAGDPDAFKKLEGSDAAIWAATRGWPHTDAQRMLAEAADVVEFFRLCDRHGVGKLVFTSSFNVEHYDLGLPDSYYGHPSGAENYYTAGKRSGEALAKAYAAINPGRSAVSVRLGHYTLRPEASPVPSMLMSDHDVVAIYRHAISAGPGYTMLRGYDRSRH